MTRSTPDPGRTGRGAGHALHAVIPVLAVGALLAGSPSPGAAQDSSVRAIATVEPSEGRRSLELMHPLTAPEVAAVQRRLTALGYRPGQPDGALDDGTRRALEAFQREEGLEVCGCVDVATVRRLDLGLRVLVTRIAGGGERSGSAGEATGVQVLYPSTTRPDPPEPAATRDSPGGEGVVRGPAPTPASAVGAGHLWTVGTVVPVPVPVFLGGDGPFPGGRPNVRPSAPRSRGGMRPVPFGRVPFPSSRPTPSSGGGR